MYRKILVAVDHSPLRAYLLRQAIGMAKVMESDLMIAHALSAYEEGSPGLPIRTYHTYYPIASSVSWQTYQHRWESYEREGLNELRQFAAEAAQQGVNAEFTQTAGDPGRVICDIADSWGANLVIIGNRGRSGLGEFLLGSVSNYVMHHAPCSVLVVHEDDMNQAIAAAADTDKTTAVV
ncbi:MAG: universal stress protein [Leptolyngbyaceae cyanobacterium]